MTIPVCIMYEGCIGACGKESHDASLSADYCIPQGTFLGLFFFCVVNDLPMPDDVMSGATVPTIGR